MEFKQYAIKSLQANFMSRTGEDFLNIKLKNSKFLNLKVKNLIF